MAEILLIFPAGKRAAARQIGDALSVAGYVATLEEVADAGGAAVAGAARRSGAALLVWSRGLASAAVLDGWLPSLRQLPNLIELSTDGIAPQSGDDSRVILLSGWRGQPFHLGWKRVLSELERLGATPTRPPGTFGTAASAEPDSEAKAAAPAATGPRGRVPRRRFVLPATAALALIGTVGAAAWIGNRSADGAGPDGRRAPALAATAPSLELPASVAGAPVPANFRPLADAGSAQQPVAPAEREGSSASARKAPARALHAAADRAAGSADKGRPTYRAPPLKRYSKKNSKTMRRFCARSGRSTPECRIFVRSMNAARS